MSEADEKLTKSFVRKITYSPKFSAFTPMGVWGDISRVQALGTGTYHTPWLFIMSNSPRVRQPFFNTLGWDREWNEQADFYCFFFWKEKGAPKSIFFYSHVLFITDITKKKDLKKKGLNNNNFLWDHYNWGLFV